MAEPFYGNPWETGQFSPYGPVPGFAELDTPPFEGDPTSEGARIAAAIRMMQSVQRPGVFRSGAPPIPQIGNVANMLQTGGTPQAPAPVASPEQSGGETPWPIGPDGVPLPQTPTEVDGIPMPPTRPWPIPETTEETSSQNRRSGTPPRPIYSDPWTPPPPTAPGTMTPPPPSGSLLSDPRARAALLSFGLHMLQPRGYGDTFSGKLGRSIGAAGETLGNIEGMDLKQDEAASKQELRGATATAAEARAGAAAANAATSGVRANAATERLQMMQVNEEGRMERNRLGARVRLSNMYQTYLKDVKTRNQNAALTRTPLEPVLLMPEWIRANPMLKDLGLLPDNADGDPDETPTSTRPNSNLTGPGKTPAGVSVQDASIPSRPSTVPAGSQYSPSRGLWRSPDGKIFDKSGKPQ